MGISGMGLTSVVFTDSFETSESEMVN